MPKAPENTAKLPPELLLAEAMTGGSSGMIERQEAQGQRSFVSSDTLPVKIHGERSTLEEAGVKFLGPVEGDALFQYVELPAGWKKVATDHSMWSRLVDDQGRERATIFYKAAFLRPRCTHGDHTPGELNVSLPRLSLKPLRVNPWAMKPTGREGDRHDDRD